MSTPPPVVRCIEGEQNRTVQTAERHRKIARACALPSSGGTRPSTTPRGHPSKPFEFSGAVPCRPRRRALSESRTRRPDVVRSSFLIVRDPQPPNRYDGIDSRHFQNFIPTDPHAPPQLKFASCRPQSSPISRRCGPYRRRAVPYTLWSERMRRHARRRGAGGRSRWPQSCHFRGKPRLGDPRARPGPSGLRDLDVRRCPTPTGASAGSAAGRIPARSALGSSREVAIFFILRAMPGMRSECEFGALSGPGAPYRVPRVCTDPTGHSE